MKIYILTSAAVLTENGEPDFPNIQTRTCRSVEQARLEMNIQFKREIKEAESLGYEITERSQTPMGCSLSYRNMSQSDIVWEITEVDVPVSSYEHSKECEEKIKALVLAHGKECSGKTVLLFPHDVKPCVGGWLGETAEIVDCVFVEEDTVYIGTEVCSRTSDELPSDDFEAVLECIEENIDLVQMYQEYYRPHHTDGTQSIEGLEEDHVFATKDDLISWMGRQGYLQGTYEIATYRGDQWTDEPVFIDGDGYEIL